MPVAPVRLKQRSEFLRVAGGRRKSVETGLILQALHQPDGWAGDVPVARVGFTASKKVGNAVARNRAKRRLREAVRQIIPTQADPTQDYVVIARRETVERPFQAIIDDLIRALKRLRLHKSV